MTSPVLFARTCTSLAMLLLVALLAFAAATVVGSEVATAQPGTGRGVPPACFSSAKLSCAVYEACFERACGCESTQHRYFITYGKKYCDRFLGATNWSAAGRAWRDKTLRCLQERIVPHLPRDGSCNCEQLKSVAFRTHVECYTQPGASVCDLSLDDWKKIYDTIDGKDLFRDDDGRKQMLSVARICAASLPDGAVKNLTLRIIGALGGGSEPPKPASPPPARQHRPDPRLCGMLGTC